MNLLSREDFRKEVFKRDNNKCIVCGKPATAAHHIIDRSLWHDGGYYLDNGASLCDEHHLKAETCELGCDSIRCFARICVVILPSDFDSTNRYDKWGNIVINNALSVRIV